MSRHAVVGGAKGRIGSAFVPRLLRDGFVVHAIDPAPLKAGKIHFGVDDEVYIFDFAYTDGQPQQHVERVVHAFAQWKFWDGIVVPSSMWATVHAAGSYGRAKYAIEQLAVFYRSLGANIVTDQIGYFPGEGVAPNLDDWFVTSLVSADDLYARIMKALLK